MVKQTGQRSTAPHPADISRAVAAYRGGLNADMLQAKIEGTWGPIWTIPPCSPVAMERAGRQFTRSRAEAVRHCRRARLWRPSAPSEAVDVVVMTEFPSLDQSVTRFDGVTLQVDVYLEDAALTALTASFSPSRS